MPRVISKNWLYLLLTFFIAFSITLVSARIIHVVIAEHNQDNIAEESTSEKNDEEDRKNEETVTTPSFINLQPIVDEWANTIVNGKAGIMVYDLDHSRIAAEYNANEPFYAASLYKLFFVYDGYSQIENSSENPDEFFVFSYDKGNLSFATCLDLMIRESYNPCADPMRADPNKFARVEDFINQFGLNGTSNAGLETTAADMVELLKIYYRHTNLSETTWQKILDSMLNQPPTTYDWRQGLPSGFKVATVYNKVGWNSDNGHWTTFNDVAIIDFPEQNRHYIVAILTSDINPENIGRFGQMLENAIINQ